MEPEPKKSFVRLKVWPALVVMAFSGVYLLLSTGGNLNTYPIPPKDLGAFVIMMAIGFFLHNVKCERCKSKWNRTAYVTYKKPVTIFDAVRKKFDETTFSIENKCRVCGMERY